MMWLEINNDKVIGIHQHKSCSPNQWIEYDGKVELGYVIVNGTPVPPTISFDEMKLSAINEVKILLTRIRAQFTDQADQYKLAGWVKKAARAERVIAGTQTEETLIILQAECDLRGKGESPQELAAKQLAKAQRLDLASAVMDGLEKSALTALEGKNTAEAVTAYLAEFTQRILSEIAKLNETEEVTS